MTFEIYANTPNKTSTDELVTEIYLPTEAKQKIKIEKLIRNKYWYLVLYVLTAVMAWGRKIYF